MELEQAADQIWQSLEDELKEGKYHSRNSLEQMNTGLLRATLRDAVSLLIAARRIEERDMPAAQKPSHGGTRSYLHPVSQPPKYGDHRS